MLRAILLLLALLAVDVSANRLIRGTWAEVGDSRSAPSPIPHPRWNPFAVCGSPAGKWLAAMMSDSSNAVFHFGVDDDEDACKPFISPLARFNHNLLTGLTPSPHAHASWGDDDKHRASRLAQYAGKSTAGMLETAYILDPTDYMALSIMSSESYGGWPEWVRKKQLEVAPGITVNAPLLIARDLCAYSLPLFDVQSGLWPEHCIYAAKTLQSLWLINVAIETKIHGEKNNPATSLEAFTDLRDRIASLLAASEKQKKALDAFGLWQRRTEDERAFIATLSAETQGFLNELNSTIERKRNASR